ncbi:hypothetical protein [Acidovorax sp. JHL-3]|nr:hypothetical protein [Acidovorax sp. JHL-3]
MLFNMTGPSTPQQSLQFDLQGTPAGVTRSKSRVPLAKLANEKLPAYSPDDGPLTTAEIYAIQADADACMPIGRVLRRMSLLASIEPLVR